MSAISNCCRLFLLAVVCHLVAPAPAAAQPACRDLCPPCSLLGDCSARDQCRSNCGRLEDEAKRLAAEITGLRDRAIERLKSDEDAAIARIQAELDARVAAAQLRIDAAMAAHRQALTNARTQARAAVLGTLNAAVTVQQDILTNFTPRMTDVATCVGGAVPAPVQLSYDAARSQTQQWVTQAATAATTAGAAIDSGRNAAEASALQAFNNPRQTLADLSAPFDAVRATATQIRTDLMAAPADPAAFKTRLEGYIRDGFATVVSKGTTGMAAAAAAGATAITSIDALRQQSQTLVDTAASSWRSQAQAAIAGVRSFDPARDVPSMQTLRARLRAEVAQWPKTLSCLCQTVDVPPHRESSNAPIADAANALEDVTDAFCAASMVMGRIPQSPQKLAALRQMRTQPPPIDTGFNPAAAQSPAGRDQLAKKADKYQEWTASHNLHGNIVVDCVEARITDRNRVGACGGNEAMSNAGGSTGKLLAASAFRLASTVPGTTQSTAALADLEATLSGLLNIMTMAGGGMGPIRSLADDSPIDPVKGLPIRGYVDADLINAEAFNLAGLDNEGKRKFYKVTGTPLGLPYGEYRFKERESPDDTFPTLVGLTAAYDVLKQRNASPEWRKRIVEAAEAFGAYWVRPGARFQIRTLRGEHTWAGDASDLKNPFHLLQNLTFLKSVMHLSEDFRGNANSVTAVKAAYDELTNRIGRTQLLDPSMVALASLFASPARNALREPMLYFYPAFTVDMWVMGGYLLVKYEQDAAQREVYRELYRRIIMPMAIEYRAAAHDLMAAASITDANQFANAAGIARSAAIGRAAASLRQYRTTPAPFGNPLPSSTNPEDAGFYYTNFSTRSDLRDPLYFHLKGTWSTLRHRHPRVWDHLKGHAGFESWFGEDQAAAWALGQGLVPKGNNSGPFAIIGGGWNVSDKKIDVFGGDHDLNGVMVKTVKAVSAIEMQYVYWLGRFHGLLKAPVN